MKAFQNVRFDLFNCVLLWATHTGEEQNKAVFFFSPLIRKAAASSPYAIHCCLLRIYTFFFLSLEEILCLFSQSLCCSGETKQLVLEAYGYTV